MEGYSLTFLFVLIITETLDIFTSKLLSNTFKVKHTCCVR